MQEPEDEAREMTFQPAQLAIHESDAALATCVAERVADLAAQAIAIRGEFRLALAGGETPRRCYEQLRYLPVNWAHVQVFFGDERCLPRGDKQRNDTMAYATLLDHVAIPPANIHTIAAEYGAYDAARNYAMLLNDYAPLDLVLLGLGEDGHTASLFPGNPATELSDAAVAVFDAPKPPPQRVSLGLHTLQRAQHRIFLVTGAGKRAALQAINDGASLPAARVGLSEWHIDRAAMPEFY
ncbi:6-phosphogluconolactonase [Sideroxydans sp. CL21]|uniref:6-phosphogluconolactonase n=1 Tax=Sideroxydans sp. CL21 TaxID=2600596 RepID=UPI0024BC88E7|nr:6-phosphogluconolactonase [Sideroxydans sp. CL21]